MPVCEECVYIYLQRYTFVCLISLALILHSPPKLLGVHSCKSYRSFLALRSPVDQYRSRTMLVNTQLKSGNKAF